MARSFNTSGPCIPEEHYMLPPERRLGRVLELIEGPLQEISWEEKLTLEEVQAEGKRVWVVGC